MALLDLWMGGVMLKRQQVMSWLQALPHAEPMMAADSTHRSPSGNTYFVELWPVLASVDALQLVQLPLI